MKIANVHRISIQLEEFIFCCLSHISVVSGNSKAHLTPNMQLIETKFNLKTAWNAFLSYHI